MKPRRQPRKPPPRPVAACTLCGSRDVAAFGVWSPVKSIQRRLGCPPGKDRIVAYAICRSCLAPGPEVVIHLVEEQLLAETAHVVK